MSAIVRLFRAIAATLVVALLLLGAPHSRAHGSMPEDMVMGEDGHKHHHAIAPYLRSTANYVVPDVTLVRSDGRSVKFGDELGDGRAVVLSFIYTSCTTVCPLTSSTLAALQNKLGDARDKVHLMSISIDPEFDTPSRLRDYAARFGAGPSWQHYTGTLAASQRTQRAFDVYRGNKMDHAPVTLVRVQPGAPWVRIDGFATADQLLVELPQVYGTHAEGQSHAQR